MKISALEENVLAEAKALADQFKPFTTGVRYLTLLYRTKDGGPSTEKLRRGGFYVTHNEKEYLSALVRLLTLQAVSSKPYRLYASVNERSLHKAERQFKIEQLEADFAPKEQHDYFYERLESQWVHAVMKPSSRATSLFMLDIDGEGDVTAPVLKRLAENQIDIVTQYKTPNGWHIVTAPFNPAILGDMLDIEVKKDGLLLLAA